MIGFTAPWALLALPLAGIPLLLHLVHRREPPEVQFPAVRYLDDATREHRRHLQLRHLLLLLTRTLIILAVVLAAAGMRLTRSALGGHLPSALALVVDNSASSSVVVDGVPQLTALIAAADAVLEQATSADQLWLRTASGPAIPGSVAQLRDRLRTMGATSGRLDLGAAIAEGRELVARANRPGEVVVVTDAQHTAVTPSSGSVPVLLLRPTQAAPHNRQITTVMLGAQPWGTDGGVVTVAIGSTDTLPVPVVVSIDGLAPHDLLLTPGVPASLRIPRTTPGWRRVVVTLPPDEFRADDARELALRVAPPPTVQWDATDRFLDAALAVLAADGRIVPGAGVTVGALGAGPSVVLPPADLALLGAWNRRLATRGIAWQFGDPVVAAEMSDSNALLPAQVPVRRRIRLVSAGAAGEVLATVGGEPWIVRNGNVLLLGSRFAPEWSELPLRTEFVPLLDALLRRAIRGELLLPEVVVDDPVVLPPRASSVRWTAGQLVVEGGAPWHPREPGVYHLMAGEDTLGAVSVVIDPRESDLSRASDADVQALWGDVVVSELNGGPSRAFTTGGRGDLRGSLLLLALLCACVEVGLAGRAGQRN